MADLKTGINQLLSEAKPETPASAPAKPQRINKKALMAKQRDELNEMPLTQRKQVPAPAPEAKPTPKPAPVPEEQKPVANEAPRKETVFEKSRRIYPTLQWGPNTGRSLTEKESQQIQNLMNEAWNQDPNDPDYMDEWDKQTILFNKAGYHYPEGTRGMDFRDGKWMIETGDGDEEKWEEFLTDRYEHQDVLDEAKKYGQSMRSRFPDEKELTDDELKELIGYVKQHYGYKTGDETIGGGSLTDRVLDNYGSDYLEMRRKQYGQGQHAENERTDIEGILSDLGWKDLMEDDMRERGYDTDFTQDDVRREFGSEVEPTYTAENYAEKYRQDLPEYIQDEDMVRINEYAKYHGLDASKVLDLVAKEMGEFRAEYGYLHDGMIGNAIDNALKEAVNLGPEAAPQPSAIPEKVDWRFFNKYHDLNEQYLPQIGEGENMANQIATAVNKIVYKWYNDGDVFDNQYENGLLGWANDLSSYANWLYDNVPETRSILDAIKETYSEDDYAKLLAQLTEATMNPSVLGKYAQAAKNGSVYESGSRHFKWTDPDDRPDEYGYTGREYEEWESSDFNRDDIREFYFGGEYGINAMDNLENEVMDWIQTQGARGDYGIEGLGSVYDDYASAQDFAETIAAELNTITDAVYAILERNGWIW